MTTGRNLNIIEAVPHHPEADSFELRVTLGNLRQAVQTRFWVVVATTLIATSIVIGYILVWPATYEVEVMIAAESEKDAQRSSFYSGWSVFRREGLVDEGALMTSLPVLKETVRRLDLKYEDVYHPFLSYATHLWTESWIGKTYRKAKGWIFPKKPNPYEPTPQEIEQYKVLADFRKGVGVDQVRDANIGLLVVKASSPRAAEIANTLVDVYFEQRRARQVAEAQAAHDSLAAEVARVQEELAAIDQGVVRFRRDNGILLQFEKEKVEVGQYQGLRLAVAEIEANIAAKEDMLRSIEKNLAAEGTAIDRDRVFKDTAIQDRVTKLEAQLAQVKQLFQPDSREVREIEEQIRIAMAGIDKGGTTIVRNTARVGEAYELLRARRVDLAAQLAGDRASLAEKRKELARMSASVGRLPEKIRVSTEFDRMVAVTESKLRVLYEKLAIATVSLATVKTAPQALRVVEYAAPPEKPVWPQTKLIVPAAVLFGLVLGVMAALVLELAFVRANRYRLWEKDAVYRVFAVVDQDRRFLDSIYGPPDLPRLPGAAGAD